MNVQQTRFGEQDSPYTDCVWTWRLEPDTDKERENILEYCQKELMQAPYTKEEYLSEMRRKDTTHHERMQVVCSGYYMLQKFYGSPYFYYSAIKENLE